MLRKLAKDCIGNKSNLSKVKANFLDATQIGKTIVSKQLFPRKHLCFEREFNNRV